jgi:hypothetical protein
VASRLAAIPPVGWLESQAASHRSRLPAEAAEQAQAAGNRQIQRLVESVYG